LFLPRIATWMEKSIYTLMSGVVVVVVLRACKDSTSICMKQFVKAAHNCGPQEVGGGGEMGCFCKDGVMTLVNEFVSTFSIKLANPRSPVPPGLFP
jgi:hypothetical protein